MINWSVGDGDTGGQKYNQSAEGEDSLVKVKGWLRRPTSSAPGNLGARVVFYLYGYYGFGIKPVFKRPVL